jgi:hypothetical protein
VCVGGLGVAVADDGVAIGEWVGIGIGHRGLNVSPPGSPGPMSALARIADSSRTSREVRKVPKNEPASQERAARGAGGGDGVTR